VVVLVLVLAEFQAASKPGIAALMVSQLGPILLLLSLALSTIGFFKSLYIEILGPYWRLSDFKEPLPFYLPKFWDF
jgi:hypothetical protein